MKVLFVGNSFTARNDVPGTVARMAASRGHELSHELIWAGGASLRAHWNKGAALESIRRGGWDRVVLQEQSTLPVKNARRFHESVRLFVPEIAAAGARATLYETWARRNAPETQRALSDAYASIAVETGADLVPVGTAWETFLRAHDRPALHDRDLSHPSPAGSYLAACVFFAVLFGESPVGLPHEAAGPGDGDAARLQETAWETARARHA
jgi:hypothetical protein